MAIDTYYLKDGSKRYRVIPYIHGKQTGAKRGFKTMREARAYEASILAKGKIVRKATFADVEEQYLEAYLHAHKESSYYTVKKRLANKVPDTWRKRDIASISVMECQRLSNQLASQYTSATSYVSTISEVFNFAKNQMEVIDVNPFDKIVKPKKHQPTTIAEPWTPDEKTAFFEAARTFRRPEAYPMFLIMNDTGMRRGEIVAISAEDFIEYDLLRIHDNMTIDRNGHEIIDTTKTETSTRTVALSQQTADAAHEYMEHFGITEGRLFQIGGNALRKWLIEIEQIAGIHHGQSHNFRRDQATTLLGNGAPLKDVQDRLGHKDASTTLSFYARANRDKRAVLQYLHKTHDTTHDTLNENADKQRG